jgi:phospholipid/cholesterol/gamma-HCH transport system permease protein
MRAAITARALKSAPTSMVSLDNVSATPDAWFNMDRNVLQLGGRWTIGESARLDGELRAFAPQGSGAITLDGSEIEKLDSAGAWLVLRTKRALEAAGRKVSGFTLPELYQPLMENLEKSKGPAAQKQRPRTITVRLEKIGRATVHAGQQGYRMLGYLGRVTV